MSVLAVSTTAWWAIGFAISGEVVLVAALLLIVIIMLARRIARQAREITAALDGARANTTPLFAVANVSHALERIVVGLRALRGAGPPRGDADVGWVLRIEGQLAQKSNGGER